MFKKKQYVPIIVILLPIILVSYYYAAINSSWNFTVQYNTNLVLYIITATVNCPSFRCSSWQCVITQGQSSDWHSSAMASYCPTGMLVADKVWPWQAYNPSFSLAVSKMKQLIYDLSNFNIFETLLITIAIHFSFFLPSFIQVYLLLFSSSILAISFPIPKFNNISIYLLQM